MSHRALVFNVPKGNEVHYSKIQGKILGKRAVVPFVLLLRACRGCQNRLGRRGSRMCLKNECITKDKPTHSCLKNDIVTTTMVKKNDIRPERE